jgi:uncharacterized membrane protein
MPAPNSGCSESIRAQYEMASTHERAALRTGLARRTRYLRRHLRLVLPVLLGIVVYLVLPSTIGGGTRLLAAFDLAAVLFLGAVWMMMARATTADMRRRSQIEDESRYVVLALSAAAAVAILLAIASELHDIRNQAPAGTGLRVTLAAVTILLAWFFMNTIFALHYAHSSTAIPTPPGVPRRAASLSQTAPSRTTGSFSTSPSSSA